MHPGWMHPGWMHFRPPQIYCPEAVFFPIAVAQSFHLPIVVVKAFYPDWDEAEASEAFYRDWNEAEALYVAEHEPEEAAPTPPPA